jgi:Fe-S-cluster containining protein
VVTRQRKKGEARRAANGRAAQQADGDSYGRLFEVGRAEELRHTLTAKVYKGLLAPDISAMERITHIVDDVISEREEGWHFGLSNERLSKVDLRADDASARLCADCALPGCCYFDIVRLTSADVERLSARLKLSSEEFVARHCTPFADAHDHRYTHALKKSKPCEFLGEDNQCHIYADRPTVCADFPFVVDPKTGDVIEIRLFPFCNLPFNVVRHEVTRRVLEGSQ